MRATASHSPDGHAFCKRLPHTVVDLRVLDERPSILRGDQKLQPDMDAIMVLLELLEKPLLDGVIG